MIHLLPTLEKAFPFLHKRAGTENDFYDLCSERNVEVIFRPDAPIGCYVMAAGEHYIFLNSHLHGWKLRYVMFHEIAHFLFHSPSQSSFGIEFFNRHQKQKNHVEAEQVAALILLPIPELENVLISGAYNAYDELAELIAIRLQMQHDYKFPVPESIVEKYDASSGS